MKRIIIHIILLLLISIIGTQSLYAQKKRKRTRELFFTYLGPTISAGYTSIGYEAWDDENDERKKFNENGPFLAAGGSLVIIAKYFQGDFSMQFMYNALSDTPLYHMFYSGNARYFHSLKNRISVTGGLGLFMETQPSNESYDGSAGIQLPIGLIYNVSNSSKLLFDLFARYGNHGFGNEHSEKLAFGINISYVFKVGRI